MARHPSGLRCQAAEPRSQLRTRRGSAAARGGGRAHTSQSAFLANKLLPGRPQLGSPAHTPQPTHRAPRPPACPRCTPQLSWAHLAGELDLHRLLVLANAAHVGVVARAAGVHLLGVHTVLRRAGAGKGSKRVGRARSAPAGAPACRYDAALCRWCGRRRWPTSKLHPRLCPNMPERRLHNCMCCSRLQTASQSTAHLHVLRNPV